jgi:hypothetical protein
VINGTSKNEFLGVNVFGGGKSCGRWRLYAARQFGFF